MTVMIPLAWPAEVPCPRCHQAGAYRFRMTIVISEFSSKEVNGYFCAGSGCGIYTDSRDENFPKLAVRPKKEKPAVSEKVNREQSSTRWKIYQVKDGKLLPRKGVEIVGGEDPAKFIFSRYGRGDFIVLEFVGGIKSTAPKHLLLAYHICTDPTPRPVKEIVLDKDWRKTAESHGYTAARIAQSFWDYIRTQLRPKIGRPKDTADDSIMLKAQRIHARLMKAQGKSYRFIWHDVYREIYNLPKDATLSWPQIQAAKALGDAARQKRKRKRLEKR